MIDRQTDLDPGLWHLFGLDILCYGFGPTHKKLTRTPQESHFVSPTLTYQNLLFCRVPINPILGFIIRTYKKEGFGRLR